MRGEEGREKGGSEMGQLASQGQRCVKAVVAQK